MLVYKEYDQEQLDLQYNNRHHVPDFETSLASWEILSRAAEKKYHVIKDILYGNLPRESLDVFPSTVPASKTLVFIHGGYWHLFDKSSFYFVAGAFADYGVTTVLLNYPFAPFASMNQIVDSCRKALAWLHENLLQVNGDPAQIFLVGHSAGGHLAAMLTTMEEARNNPTYIKGVCLISGIFNLIPIHLSGINAVLQMNHSVACEYSPLALTPSQSCPVIIAVGSAETAEFKDQSSELYRRWKSQNQYIEFLEIPKLNHFTILDSLSNANSILHQTVCKLITG